jgi:hypothetical protein
MSDLREQPGPSRTDRRIRDAFRAEAVGRAPDRILEAVFGRTQAMPQSRRWPWDAFGRSTRRLGGASLVAAAALALGLVGSLLSSGGGPRPVPTATPAVLSPPASAAATVCDGGTGLSAAGSRLWVACRAGAQAVDVSASPPASGAVIAGIGLPVAGPAGVFAPSTSGLVELDPNRASIRRALPGTGVTLLAVGQTMLWTVSTDQVLRVLDPSDAHVLGSVELDAAPLAMLAAGDRVWVGFGDGTARRFDGPSLTAGASVPTGRRPARLAESSRYLFILSTDADALLTRVDLGSDLAVSVSVADRSDPRAVDLLAASDDGVWITRRDLLIRLDPGSLAPGAPVGLSAYPAGIAIGSGALWAYEAGGRIERFTLR